MFPFGKSEQQKRIDELAKIADQLLKREKELLAEIANTGMLLQSARDGLDIAGRQNAHLQADNRRLEGALISIYAMGTPGMASIGKRMAAVAFNALPLGMELAAISAIPATPNGTAAAVQGAL